MTGSAGPDHRADSGYGAGQGHDADPERGARPDHDAVVLAGGRARRLGGASKPDVVLAGRRLLDRTLDAAVGARRVVVVGPSAVAPPGVLVALEDPPGAGPVAAVAAGLAALAGGGGLVLLLACDVPRGARAVDDLFAALAGPDAAELDGAVLVDDDGRAQPLLGLYRRPALAAALERVAASGGLRDAPVRRLVEPLALAAVPDPDGAALDVDSWADLVRAERLVRADDAAGVTDERSR